MVVLKHFTAEVRSNGVELPTFDDPDILQENLMLQSKTLIKYIQAEPNTEFEVFFGLDPSVFGDGDPDRLCIDLRCDGLHLRCKLVRKRKKDKHHYTFEGLKAKNEGGEWQLLPFIFDALNKSECV